MTRDEMAVHKYLAGLGRIGGAAGTGAKKSRGTSEYYKAMSDKGVAARKAKAQAWPMAKPEEGLAADTNDRLHLYVNDADFQDEVKQ